MTVSGANFFTDLAVLAADLPEVAPKTWLLVIPGPIALTWRNFSSDPIGIQAGHAKRRSAGLGIQERKKSC